MPKTARENIKIAFFPQLTERLEEANFNHAWLVRFFSILFIIYLFDVFLPSKLNYDSLDFLLFDFQVILVHPT